MRVLSDTVNTSFSYFICMKSRGKVYTEKIIVKFKKFMKAAFGALKMFEFARKFEFRSIVSVSYIKHIDLVYSLC